MRPTKVLKKTEADYEPVNRWWEAEGVANKGKRGAEKWESMEHHGIVFAEPYVPHRVPLIYNGKEVPLSQEAEEIAGHWHGVQNSEYPKVEKFVKNFFEVFKRVLPDPKVAPDGEPWSLDKCDFSKIFEKCTEYLEERKNRDKAAKEEESNARKREMEFYSYALVDGIREK